MMGPTPGDTLPWALPRNTRDTPRRLENSSQPPRNSGAKRTRTCRNFGAFKKESPRAAEWHTALLATTRVTQRTFYAVRCVYREGSSQDIFLPSGLRRSIGVLGGFLSGGRRGRSQRPLFALRGGPGDAPAERGFRYSGQRYRGKRRLGCLDPLA